jgi:hypothetical protein
MVLRIPEAFPTPSSFKIQFIFLRLALARRAQQSENCRWCSETYDPKVQSVVSMLLRKCSIFGPRPGVRLILLSSYVRGGPVQGAGGNPQP